MLIVSLVMLLLVFFAAMFFLFKRLMDQNVVQATQHLDEMNQEFVEKEKTLEKEMEEARLKAEQMITSAKQDAEKLKFEIVAHAEKEAEGIVAQARHQGEEIVQQADKSRSQLLSEIDERIAKGAVLKACELIESTLPEEFKKVVHVHWLDDLIDNGFGRLSGMHVPQDTGEIKVTSAYPLTDAQRQKLTQRLCEVLGRQVEVKEELNPHTIAGVVITVGSLVLDGSLKNKIQENAR
jgi:F0F1-type ATP synthase membrane subunit b/b'